MSDEGSARLPWTEAQWARFPCRSDLRSMRYGDLFETLRDHPHRDRIIASEMGWDRQEGDGEGDEEQGPATDDLLEMAGRSEDDDAAERLDPRGIPAYAEAFEWGLSLLRLLKEVGGAGASELNAEDREAVEAISLGSAVAARIAGGAAMGDDDETICASIVRFRQAQEMAESAVAALRELAGRGIAPPERVQPLVQEGEKVCRIIAARVSELRTRVWWE